MGYSIAAGVAALVQSANFTRPADATAYASGDLVANSTVAGSVVPMTFDVGRATDLTVAIRRVRVKKTSTSVTNASFRLHLYQTAPTVTNGDNGAWLSIMAGYLGNVDVTVDKAFSDGAGGVGSPASGVEINAQVGKGTTTIFGLLEARAAYTPGNAEVITVELELWQN